MHALPVVDGGSSGDTIETVDLPEHQMRYLSTAAQRVSPGIPDAFALPYVIRSLIERLEESKADVSGLFGSRMNLGDSVKRGFPERAFD